MSVIRYTRFVFLGKHMLWVLVTFMVALLVWIASDNKGDNASRIVFSSVSKGDNGETVMIKPYYQSVDRQNQPYAISADKGTQIDKDNVALEKIIADITRSDGKWAAMNANEGRIHVPTKQLELSGGVEIFYDGGYIVRTDHAHVDMQQGSAYGDSRVEVQGPLGTLVADRFSIAKRGKIMQFNGSVRMKLYR